MPLCARGRKKGGEVLKVRGQKKKKRSTDTAFQRKNELDHMRNGKEIMNVPEILKEGEGGGGGMPQYMPKRAAKSRPKGRET